MKNVEIRNMKYEKWEDFSEKLLGIDIVYLKHLSSF